MEIEGLVSAESGEPTTLKVDEGTTWLIFIREDSIQAGKDFTDLIQSQQRSAKFYLIEAEGKELDLEELGSLSSRCLYLDDESMLEKYQIENFPWFLCFDSGQVLYSSDKIPNLPIRTKQRRDTAKKVPDKSAGNKAKEDKNTKSKEKLQESQKKIAEQQKADIQISERKEEEKDEFNGNLEIEKPIQEQPEDLNLEDKKQALVINNQQTDKDNILHLPPPQPIKDDLLPNSSQKFRYSPQVNRKPLPLKNTFSKPSPKDTKTFDYKGSELKQIKQKINNYERRIKDYEDEVNTLTQTLSSKEREVETLKQLLEMKKNKKPEFTPEKPFGKPFDEYIDKPFVPERAQPSEHDSDFWKFPEEEAWEGKMNFDELANKRNLWIANIERNTEKTQLAKLNLEKQRQEHIFKSSIKPADDKIPIRQYKYSKKK